MATHDQWWRHGIIYQIVPQSFMDTDGDGMGDLDGIRDRLEYLEWLGADAVWIGPIYPSPMKDFGYDISDYLDVHPAFGTLQNFDLLLAEAHARGIKVMLDLVPNHTSDLHPWFVESRSSRESPKRDWYLWKDPGPGGGPPNNWMSVFSGNGWHYDDHTSQYYYHAFTPNEPNLNWRNPDVQKAMLDVMRFWLDRGVDGFRLDAPWYLVKDAYFRHNPFNPNWSGERKHEQFTPAFSEDQPEVHEILQRMRRLTDEYDERVLMGEFYLPQERMVSYYGPASDELQLPCNYTLTTLPWEPKSIAETISRYEGMLPPENWPTWALGNHDLPRIAGRVGREQARVAAMLLLTLRGTPLLYYGEEIGMRDVAAAAEKESDPQVLDYPNGNRMPYRMPMQWSAEPQAGFTAREPWLPIAGDYEQWNVETQRRDGNSMLSLYRRLIALRRAEPALHSGRFVPLPTTGSLLPYLREADGSRLLIVLNLGDETATYRSEWMEVSGQICAATRVEREGEKVAHGVEMEPNDGVVIKLA